MLTTSIPNEKGNRHHYNRLRNYWESRFMKQTNMKSYNFAAKSSEKTMQHVYSTPHKVEILWSQNQSFALTDVPIQKPRQIPTDKYDLNLNLDCCIRRKPCTENELQLLKNQLAEMKKGQEKETARIQIYQKIAKQLEQRSKCLNPKHIKYPRPSDVKNLPLHLLKPSQTPFGATHPKSVSDKVPVPTDDLDDDLYYVDTPSSSSDHPSSSTDHSFDPHDGYIDGECGYIRSEFHNHAHAIKEKEKVINCLEIDLLRLNRQRQLISRKFRNIDELYKCLLVHCDNLKRKLMEREEERAGLPEVVEKPIQKSLLEVMVKLETDIVNTTKSLIVQNDINAERDELSQKLQKSQLIKLFY